MKINATFERQSYDRDGNIELTFKTSRVSDHWAKSLEYGGTYTLEAVKAKPKRTLEQNALMWALIHDIAEHRNGRANTDNEWDVYIEALERAGAKYEVLTCVPEAEKILRDTSRAIKLLTTAEVHGRTFNAYKVFYGSSKMDKAEMAKLLDEIINIAYEEGIDVIYQF